VEHDVLPVAARAYLVIVALNGADDKPDLNTLRAFVASTSQGIAYHAAVWHHPMIALEHTIDFTCIENQTDVPGSILHCEIVDVGGSTAGFPVVRLSFPLMAPTSPVRFRL